MQMSESNYRGTIDGLAVEGELLTIRPPIGQVSYTGTVRMAPRDADELARRVLNPDREADLRGLGF